VQRDVSGLDPGSPRPEKVRTVVSEVSSVTRKCGTCQHVKRAEIDRRLAAGEPGSQIARDYDLNPSSLHRHRVNCLGLSSSNAIMKEVARDTAAVACLPSKNNLSEVAYRIDPALWVRRILDVEPQAWQERFLRAPRGASILALTARQAGKTTTAAWAITNAALFEPGSLSVVACPAHRQSAEAVRRVREAVIKAGSKLEVDNVYGLELTNGSRVLALPGSRTDGGCLDCGGKGSYLDKRGEQT